MALLWEGSRNRRPAAAFAGSVECVRLLLRGSDLRARDGEGRDALMMAALGGSGACVEKLSSAFALRAADARGRTAFAHAVAAEDGASSLRALTDAALAAGDFGIEAAGIAAAVRRGRVDLLEMLVRGAGPDARVAAYVGLAAAIQEGSSDCMAFLMPIAGAKLAQLEDMALKSGAGSGSHDALAWVRARWDVKQLSGEVHDPASGPARRTRL